VWLEAELGEEDAKCEEDAVADPFIVK